MIVNDMQAGSHSNDIIPQVIHDVSEDPPIIRQDDVSAGRSPSVIFDYAEAPNEDNQQS